MVGFTSSGKDYKAVFVMFNFFDHFCFPYYIFCPTHFPMKSIFNCY